MDWWDLPRAALAWGAIILVTLVIVIICAAAWHLILGAHRRDERPWRHDPDEAARYRAEMRTEWNTDWQRAGGGAVPGEAIGGTTGDPPTYWIGRPGSNVGVSQALYAELSRRFQSNEPMWPRP